MRMWSNQLGARLEGLERSRMRGKAFAKESRILSMWPGADIPHPPWVVSSAR